MCTFANICACIDHHASMHVASIAMPCNNDDLGTPVDARAISSFFFVVCAAWAGTSVTAEALHLLRHLPTAAAVCSNSVCAGKLLARHSKQYLDNGQPHGAVARSCGQPSS